MAAMLPRAPMIGNKVVGGAKDVNGRSAAEEHVAGSKGHRSGVRALHGADPELVDAGGSERRTISVMPAGSPATAVKLTPPSALRSRRVPRET